jgi:hypothetical protein
MTPSVQALLADFENEARKAQQIENELRKRLTEEIGRLERRRAFAFRRTQLMRLLAGAAVGADSEEAAISAQRRAVREELGWSSEGPAYSRILDRLQPVGGAVWQCARGERAGEAAAVYAELEAFEAWFENEHSKSFYALFDQYVPEVPVVDF